MLIADCLLQVLLLMPARISSTSSELQILQPTPHFGTDQLTSRPALQMQAMGVHLPLKP